jgi:hypothetical protein
VDALRGGDWKTANSIHCRLGQAIPGTMCPREIRGPSSKVSTQVDRLFVDYCHGEHEFGPKLVDQFCQLLQIS